MSEAHEIDRLETPKVYSRPTLTFMAWGAFFVMFVSAALTAVKILPLNLGVESTLLLLLGAAIASAIIVYLIDRSAIRETRETLKLDAARDASLRAQNPDLAKATSLQRSAVVRHANSLRNEMRALKLRAGVAYLFGIALCLIAVAAGPLVAYTLAIEHPEHWQYMLGGSTLALIALAAATALLRHDSKLQEQIAAANRELHYFHRVETGLDCALTLGEGEYRTGLERVVQHLLTPPPSLEMQVAAEGKSDGSTDKGKSSKDSDGKAEDLVDQAAELFKQVAKSSAKS